MESNEKVMCIYCAQWKPKQTMTPMYEEGKEFVNYYCPNCIDTVKSAVYKLPYYKLFRFGQQGE